jgi:hypothetical protein
MIARYSMNPRQVLPRPSRSTMPKLSETPVMVRPFASRNVYRTDSSLTFSAVPRHVAEFIAQAQLIAMAKPIKTCTGTLFFETEEAAGHFAVNATAFEDTTMDHQVHYQNL